ncbi:CTP synthase [Blattabacterium cuenoti]|uniref:CTP synthase n=1 Tax=Blattabacterium cuenoti TaxID=1653831 RepID=UPI00163D0B41|nr:CTP synthase [Blattabacterium cuenoti]
METKYIFITGGVTSSLGKGIISASLGILLKSRGYRVTILKLDPYFNVDSGTMNPYEHGECFVTKDGAETDLDLGHYERFLNQETTKRNNVTSGLIYKTVLQNERKGKYLGKTVQVIPHITDEIKRRIKILGESGNYDIIITEIGGTVGDIEVLPYIESVRQLKWELGKFNGLSIHLTLLPYISVTGEIKTKPTQHSVRKLMENGIQSDIIVCRTKKHISQEIKKKIALFCNVQINNVIESIDTKIIYEIPYLLNQQQFDNLVLTYLKLKTIVHPNLRKWNFFIKKYKNPKYEITIALVGKYVSLHDSYKSIEEALIHGGTTNNILVHIKWVDSGLIRENNVKNIFYGISGILIAPGFGNRGIEGKILATKYARENKIPFFGICLGMQIAIIEFSRNVLGIETAESHETNQNAFHPVISLMESQKKIIHKGGTMRLGNWKCIFKENSKIFSIYGGLKEIFERHRHRYEFNNNYLEYFSNTEMEFVGINPDTGLVEAIELKGNDFFLGVQYHPEYNSSIINPHPLFVSFVKVSNDYNNQSFEKKKTSFV